MSYQIIDYPHFVAEPQYNSLLDVMIKRLAKLSETLSVYQVGGISSPGISDLDLIVVFKNEESVTKNFLKNLSLAERYLFIHNLYGISQHDFTEAENFTFFNNFTLLYGTDMRSNSKLQPEETRILKKQIAIEYLLKMFINAYLQNSYRVLRLRDILLHVKALQYDLDFLEISSGRILELISQIIDWRKNWFKCPPSKKDIIQWWNEFHKNFSSFMHAIFNSHKFYLPQKAIYKISNSITFVRSSEMLTPLHNGFLLSDFLSFLGKRYFKLQNKFNFFQFNIPITTENVPEILEKKFLFEKRHFDYNRKYLPYFYPLTLNFHVK